MIELRIEQIEDKREKGRVARRILEALPASLRPGSSIFRTAKTNCFWPLGGERKRRGFCV